MMRNEFLKIMFLGLAMMDFASSDSFAENTAKNTVIHLDRTEVQRFEQRYESWVQSIVKQAVPKAGASVLVEFDYSNNPDLIQTYEERRAVSHLPGLPDLTESDNGHPTENPLYELVSNQNIKVIFDQNPGDDQIRIVKEILKSKLNLDLAHGDHVTFDTFNRSNAYFEKAKGSLSKNSKLLIVLTILSALGALGLMFRREQSNRKMKEVGEKEVNALYQKLNPLSLILKTETKLLISVIRKQDKELIVQVMSHAPVQFNQIILQIFEDEERTELFNQYQANRLQVSLKRSRYSQLLLAAKIHDESKIEAIQQVDVISEMAAKISEQKMNMQDSLMQLKTMFQARQDSMRLPEEVNHDATI